MEKTINIVTSANLWVSIGIFIAGIVVTKLMKKYVNMHLQKDEVYGKKETNIRFIANVIKYVIAVFTVILILQVNGINVGSLVAGLGIVGIIVGFALQDILKDLIMGTNIVWDNFFAVGDVIKYKNIEGEVIYFNVKVTRIKEITTGNIMTISSRNISEITVLSNRKDMLIPAPYSEPAEKMRRICEEICSRVEEHVSIDRCRFLGTDEFADSYINYRITLECPPQFKYAAKRIVLETVQDVYAENDIEIPYPQMDIHLDRIDTME